MGRRQERSHLTCVEIEFDSGKAEARIRQLRTFATGESCPEEQDGRTVSSSRFPLNAILRDLTRHPPVILPFFLPSFFCCGDPRVNHPSVIAQPAPTNVVMGNGQLVVKSSKRWPTRAQQKAREGGDWLRRGELDMGLNTQLQGGHGKQSLDRVTSVAH